MIKKGIYITSIAILLFFAVSFLTVLTDFGTPFWEPSATIDVGFPFTYYEEFFLGFKHHGWRLEYLLLDAFLTWVLIFVIWKFKK